MIKGGRHQHGVRVTVNVARNMLCVAIAWAVAGPLSPVDGAERPVGKVVSCTFSTKSLPPPFRVPKKYADGYKLFRATGALLPEAVTIKGVVLMGQGRVGLSTKEVKGLYAGLDKVYGSISSDPLFKGVNSVLPFCLADTPPSQGHYFAYYPDKASAESPVIVFLHGFGGNFLFYTYLLKEEFPDAVILLPSWGASWYDGTMQYLNDMYSDVKRRESLAIRAPCLMAISAGGPGGFRLYNEAPRRFSCLVSLAAAPSSRVLPTLKPELKVLMVNGKHDSGLPISVVQSVADRLAERLARFQFHIVDSDHYFLLTKRQETFRVIKAFVAKELNDERHSTTDR
jgi:pimeloyl-ACP methyl ester carboxylesterase